MLLLLLLPPNAFTQAHLLKHRPFRATDTEHSGGDHICDLRRYSDTDGKPDRLGDYVRVHGTVIAEPSTYETGGWLFCIREAGCGVLVYGEREAVGLGDSVEVRGTVRLTNGNYFFPETGLATLGDIAIENEGVTLIGAGGDIRPVEARALDVCLHPERFAGNLVAVCGLSPGDSYHDGGDVFVRMSGRSCSLTAYIDTDTGALPYLDIRRCYALTGIVVRMKTPQGLPSPTWCIAPRGPGDIVIQDCSTLAAAATWGGIKTSAIQAAPSVP